MWWWLGLFVIDFQLILHCLFNWLRPARGPPQQGRSLLAIIALGGQLLSHNVCLQKLDREATLDAQDEAIAAPAREKEKSICESLIFEILAEGDCRTKRKQVFDTSGAAAQKTRPP